jgi:hypothetical protein
MSFLESALKLAGEGFHVFPLVPGSKLPAIDDFPERATRDPSQIHRWWTDPVMGLEQPYNIGISTSRYGGPVNRNGDCEALVVVDIDNKGEKHGDQTIFALELEGKEFPETYTVETPSGGRHLYYRVEHPLRQGTDVLGSGVDVRSRGGLVVGQGSEVQQGLYVDNGNPVVPAPAWLVVELQDTVQRDARTAPEAIDPRHAESRAVHYLTVDAPPALAGQGGDQTTFRVAARVKDIGVGESVAVTLMAEHWNPRCEPPWDINELRQKVANAYRYGALPVGASSPEADFSPLPPLDEEQDDDDDAAPASSDTHPFEQLNEEYAFVLAGGGSHILWETKDHRGFFKLEHLTTDAFHKKLAARTMTLGDGKTRPLSTLWMRSPIRRSYDGICFMPGLQAPPRFYNLWRGFTVLPFADGDDLPRDASESLEMFLDHARTNVCHGDEVLFRWLMGYFAHLVQQPWDKPLVALVFRGSKGVGKNALVDRVGHLLGNHYLLTSNRRYLVGNFNGHLENCLLFALDEAFWSGDKQAEGTLKDLITGKTHVVEHKGKEPYAVENCTRVVIIGNEDWLVPASQDERRFAVFNVGEGRKQDRAFFRTMREGMERGGYRLLLRYLLDFDLSGIEVNDAPRTSALLDQKVSSLDPFYQWWLECLSDGRLAYSELGGRWPTEIDKDQFRSAFRRYVKERQIRSRIPDDRTIGKLLSDCLPSVDGKHKRKDGEDYVYVYRMPPLPEARAAWEKYIGHAVKWE